MITLELPYTSGGGASPGDAPILVAPTFGRTDGMSRWHIPRDGQLHGRTGRRTFSVWCSASSLRPDDLERPALMVDEISDGVPICGGCAGRAVGAGVAIPAVQVEHEGGLIFEPYKRVQRPRWCPGSRYARWHEQNWRVGRCYVCLDYWPISRGRGGYDTGMPTLAKHEPGPALVDPCPFHAWDRISADGVCSCGTPSVPLDRPATDSTWSAE